MMCAETMERHVCISCGQSADYVLTMDNGLPDIYVCDSCYEKVWEDLFFAISCDNMEEFAARYKRYNLESF